MRTEGLLYDLCMGYLDQYFLCEVAVLELQLGGLSVNNYEMSVNSKQDGLHRYGYYWIYVLIGLCLVYIIISII